MMNTQLSWTQKLGDAVLAQQSDVMDAVQRLRARAQANKKLETTKEQKVSLRTEQNKQVIVIEPAQPDTVYVPYYNPSVVYGEWPYPSYPPYYYPPAPAYYGGALLATGLAFGAGVALGAWASGGWGARLRLGQQQHQREPQHEHQQHQRKLETRLRRTARACATTMPRWRTSSARAIGRGGDRQARWATADAREPAIAAATAAVIAVATAAVIEPATAVGGARRARMVPATGQGR